MQVFVQAINTRGEGVAYDGPYISAFRAGTVLVLISITLNKHLASPNPEVDEGYSVEEVHPSRSIAIMESLAVLGYDEP